MDIFDEAELDLAYSNCKEVRLPKNPSALLANPAWRKKLSNPKNLALLSGSMMMPKDSKTSDILIEALKPRNHSLMRHFLASDPGRQNIHEKTGLTYLEETFEAHSVSTGLGASFRRLRNDGDSTEAAITVGSDGNLYGCALHVNGAGHPSLVRTLGSGGSKTLDGVGHVEHDDRHVVFLFTLKYTRDSGGAQDNQRADVEKTLSKLKQSGSVLDTVTDDDDSLLRSMLLVEDDGKPMVVHAVAMVDGAYYTRKDQEKRKLVLSNLDHGSSNDARVHVVGHDEIGNLLTTV